MTLTTSSGMPRVLARRLAAQLPDRTYQRAASAAGRARRMGVGARNRARRATRRTPVPGLLSVVVPCYLVEEYLDDCLISLRFQDYVDVEIIVVDDGSPDGSGRIARAHRRRDLRVRVVRRANGGLSAARNTGVEHARGEFLTFVDSDDLVPTGAFASAVAALQESGSDFTVSYYDRVMGNRERFLPAGRWIREAHRHRRLGLTLDEFPDIMVNAVAWGKVYRRDFWDRAELSFPEGRLYEDQPTSMAAFARARRFDVLPDVGVHWRIRTDQSSITQRTRTVANLEAHNETVRESLALLRAAGKDEAASIRAVQLLANNMIPFNRHLGNGDETFWQLLRECTIELLDLAPPELYRRQVPAPEKLLSVLIRENRRDEAAQFLDLHDPDVPRFRTHTENGEVRAELPFTDTVPADTNLMSDNQLWLSARVPRAWWSTDGALHLQGWAVIREIDLEESPPSTSVHLVSLDGSQRLPFIVEQRREPRMDIIEPHAYADYRAGGFDAVLPAGSIPVGPDAPTTWQVVATVTAGGVTRTSPITELSFSGSGGLTLGFPVGPGVLATLAHRSRVLSLRVERRPQLVDLVTTAEGRTRVEIVAADADDVAQVVLSHHGRPRVLLEAGLAGGPDRWTAEFDLDRLPAEAQRGGAAALPIVCYVIRRDGSRVPVLATADLPRSPGASGGPGRHVLTRGLSGDLEMFDRMPIARRATTTDDDDFVVDVEVPDALAGATFVMETSKETVRGSVVPGDGHLKVSFPLSRTRWGRPGLALPLGKYVVHALDGSGAKIPVTPSAELTDALPIELPRRRHSPVVEVEVGRVPVLALLLTRPLDDDELGERNQTRLRAEAASSVADADSVFFRSLYGEVANCNGAAVHRELRARGAELQLVWSVVDHSVPVPEGASALIEGSRAWHLALARSRYHMVNVHQFPWFTKPEGQVMIQTMHGYPYKVMGHDWWEKGGFPDSQVRNFDRRAREWDYFVSPATYATPLLERAFLAPAGANPQILEIGYPRNDILVSPHADEIRARTRELLGIRPDQVVVMYAPTFRDYLSADDFSASRVDHFDAVAATEALGDRYAVLVRGHAFNARAGGRIASDAVIDVTDHPDINDLILASDVAVLDYSSLRFDYAITGKPMIFLTPDQERYDQARGGVIDFAPTAPGPRVDTSEETVELLRDVDALAATCRPLIADFRRAYADLEDGHASARLVDAVFVPRGDAPPSSQG